MKRSLLALVALLGCARSPPYPRPHGEMVLTIDGRVRGAPISLDADALRSVERRTVRGRGPVADEALDYEGASVLALLHHLDPQREVDLAVVHGHDGYVVAVPLPAIRQHQPVLADRAGGRAVGEALPGAGRLILAWPNVDAPGFDVDPRARWWWVRDVTRIDLVSWFETYGRALRVPAGAGDDARRGADRFSTSCIGCHRMRDAGGTRGPDLTKGIPPQDVDRLFAAVRAHADRVPETRGANLTQGLPEVAAFLEAVEIAGPLPPEDTPPEMRPRDEPPPGMTPPSGPSGY